jgi:hypothetical protein
MHSASERAMSLHKWSVERTPTCFFEGRFHGPEKIGPTEPADFCNNIVHNRTRALRPNARALAFPGTHAAIGLTTSVRIENATVGSLSQASELQPWGR